MTKATQNHCFIVKAGSDIPPIPCRQNLSVVDRGEIQRQGSPLEISALETCFRNVICGDVRRNEEIKSDIKELIL